MKIYLRIGLTSWTQTDNYNLFDHQEKEEKISRQKFQIYKDSILTRNVKQIQLKKQSLGKVKGLPIMEIILSDNHYQLRVINDKINDHKLYRLVTSDKSAEHTRLKDGDILKLGLVTVNIIRLYKHRLSHKQDNEHYASSTLSEDQPVKNYEVVRSVQSASLDHKDSGDRPSCRICLNKSSYKDNPIIACCSCKGDSRFIHIKCLDRWLRDRMTVCSSRDVIGFSKRGVTCELCRGYFDFRVILQLSYQKHMSAFCIIEHSLDKQYVYLLNLTDINEFILGRGNSSDFSINDDTISRKHCKIHYDDIRGRFFVSDMESKFGTLMELESTRFTGSVMVQLDRHILKIDKVIKKSFLQKIFVFCSPYQNVQEGSQEEEKTTKNNRNIRFEQQL